MGKAKLEATTPTPDTSDNEEDASSIEHESLAMLSERRVSVVLGMHDDTEEDDDFVDLTIHHAAKEGT